MITILACIGGLTVVGVVALVAWVAWDLRRAR